MKRFYRKPSDNFDDVTLIDGDDTIPDADYQQQQDVPCLREDAEREQWGEELRQELGWTKDAVPRLQLTETEFVVEDDEQYNIIAEHFPDENAVTIDLRTHEVDPATGDVERDAAGNKKRSKRLRGSDVWPKILEYFGHPDRISKFKGGYEATNMISFNDACRQNGNDLELAVLQARSGQVFAQSGFTKANVTITKLIVLHQDGNETGGSTPSGIAAARQIGPNYDQVYFDVE